MDRLLAMKMAAAAGDSDDVQVSNKESIAQDFGDDNDSCYFCGSLILSCLLWMQPCTEPPSSEGELWTASRAFKLHANHGTRWACFDSKANTATRQGWRASLGIHGPHRTSTPSATRTNLPEVGPQVCWAGGPFVSPARAL